MASVQTSAYQGRYLKLTVIEESYSIANNTSTVRWTLESLGGSSKYYTVYNCSVVVNGETVYNPGTVSYSTQKFPAAAGSTSGTKIIQHNSDGTAGPIGFTLHGKVFTSGDENLSGSLPLTTIPRNSAVSLSKTTFDIGEIITINTNRQSSTFTHTLRLSIGSLNKTLATGVGASYNWSTNANQDLYSQVYNMTKRTGTIYCDCYSGSVLIGTSSVSFTAEAVGSTISSNANWTAGNALTVNISRPSNNYTHTVQALVDGKAVATTTNVATSVTFDTIGFNTNVFKELAQQGSKASSIKIITYNGTAEIGSHTITGTVTAPAASTANAPTWTAGNSYTANITRANSSFTHTVELLVGTTSIFTSTGVETSVSKNDTTFHTSIFTALAQSASKPTTVKVTTYYNGVQVRSQTSNTGTVIAPAASTSTIDNFNIGDTKTITITRANSAFTHKIEAIFGSFSKTLSTNAGTSLNWNTSTDASNLYAQIPNSNSGTGTIRTTTYYNGVQVRTYTSKTFIAHVTNSNPTFTAFTYKDNNNTTSGITGNNQLQIQDNSNLVITATAATPKNSAKISKYTATINGKVYESTTTTINVGQISSSGNLSLVVKAVDSRGNTTSVTKDITVLPYTEPSYTVNVTRKNNYEEETTLNITNGKYELIPINNVNKNAIQTSRYRYKASDGNYSSWIAITLTKSGANFSFSGLVGNLDNTKTFLFQVQIIDKLKTVTEEFTLKNGTPVMAIRKNVIGINKIPKISKGLDVEGAISIPVGNNVSASNSYQVNGIPILRNNGADTLLAGNNGMVYLRPNGNNNSSGQATLSTNGNFTATKFTGPLDGTATNATNAANANNLRNILTNPTTGTWLYITCFNGNQNDGYYAARTNDGLRYNTYEGTTDAEGWGIIALGNNIAAGNAKNKHGVARIYSSNTGYVDLRYTSSTANRIIYLPDANGTIALTTSNVSSATKVYSTTTNPTSDTSYAIPFHSGISTGNKDLLNNDGIRYSTKEGTAEATGHGILSLGNTKSTGTATNKYGMLRLYSTTDKYVNLRYFTGSDVSVTQYLPRENGTIQLKPTSLYENSSGTNGTVTLSQTAANFVYLEIFYFDMNNGVITSTKIWSPNGKAVSLEVTTKGNETNLRINAKRVSDRKSVV